MKLDIQLFSSTNKTEYYDFLHPIKMLVVNFNTTSFALSLYHIFDASYDESRGYSTQAECVVVSTWLIAKHRTWATQHIDLHCIAWILMPTHKTAVGVSSSPHRHHWQALKRCKMYIGRDHRHHHITITQ